MTCCSACAYGRAVPAAARAYANAPQESGGIRIGLPLPEHIARGECLPLPDGMRDKLPPEISDEDRAALAAVSHVTGRLLRAKEPSEIIEGLRANPWVVEAISGVTNRPETPESIGNALDVLRQADDVFSSVWDAVKDVVPYGQQIDKLHQARRQLTDKLAPRSESRGGRASPRRALVAEMQSLYRRKRRGDRAATAEVVRLKEAAERDVEARRRWHVYVAVATDDLARIR